MGNCSNVKIEKNRKLKDREVSAARLEGGYLD